MPAGLAFLVFAVSLVVKIWALVDATTHPEHLYRAADKRSKAFWVGILVAAVLFSWPGGAIGLLGIAGMIAAIVYLVDVRPALRELSGR